MKVKRARVIVNVLMFLTLIFLMLNTNIVSITIHFLIGLFFAVLIFAHILLNGKFFVAGTRAILTNKIKQAMKRQLLTNWLLLIIWSGVIFSGVMEYFQEKNVELSVFWHIHVILSILGCIFIIIHIYQHRKQIYSYVKGHSKQA